jgi:hypothetical protein
MLKLFIISFVILSNFQQYSTDCVDGRLYCFDSKGIRFPNSVTVGQCWKWKRLACEPCAATYKDGQISFSRYLPTCQYHYPGASLVLETKSLWEKRTKALIAKGG